MWFVICAEGMLHPSVTDSVQQLLCDASMGDLAKWKSVSKFLMDEKVMYKMKLKADELLVHPKIEEEWACKFSACMLKGKESSSVDVICPCWVVPHALS